MPASQTGLVMDKVKPRRAAGRPSGPPTRIPRLISGKNPKKDGSTLPTAQNSHISATSSPASSHARSSSSLLQVGEEKSWNSPSSLSDETDCSSTISCPPAEKPPVPAREIAQVLLRRPRDLAFPGVKKPAPHNVNSRPPPTGCEADISSSGSTNSISTSERDTGRGTRSKADCTPTYAPVHVSMPPSSGQHQVTCKSRSSPTEACLEGKGLILNVTRSTRHASSPCLRQGPTGIPTESSRAASPQSSSSACSLPPVKIHSTPTRQWWDNSFCSGMNRPRSTTPEHYLTPLQQKEVVIEHLRSCLGDAEWQREQSEREVMSLKQQMERMREDWVEEECHRVEAQLALQQARREIQRLHDALETVQGCLQEKDQGIWRCFADITEQNRKLEVLLNDIEIAEYGSWRGNTEEYNGDALAFTVSDDRSPSLGFFSDDRSDPNTERPNSGTINASSTVCSLLSQRALVENKFDFPAKVGQRVDEEQLLWDGKGDTSKELARSRGSCGCKHVGVQADVVTCEVLRVSGSCVEAEQPVMEESDQGASSRGDADGDTSPPAQRPRPRKLLDLSPSDPCTLLLLSEQYARAAAAASRSSLCPCIGLSPAVANRVGPTTVAKALAATVEYREAQQIEPETFWSRYALLDWLALAVPALPTVAWLICRQRAPVEPEPLYNMATVLRGCCLLALPALRVAVRRVRSGKAGH